VIFNIVVDYTAERRERLREKKGKMVCFPSSSPHHREKKFFFRKILGGIYNKFH
jgi:hypothetical protein